MTGLSPIYRFSASQPKSAFGKRAKLTLKLRPKPDVDHNTAMLQAQPALRKLATSKSVQIETGLDDEA
ncbi:MAG: hypothetical protein ABJF05_14775 [Paracoccaceae bacterium]